MNQKQTDITTGKQIRHLRTQSGMTQEELAGELNDSACRVTFNSPASSSCVIPNCVRR